MSNPICVYIIEDDDEFRDLIRTALESEQDIKLSGEFEDVESFLESHDASFDVLLLDHQLPGINGVDALKSIRQKSPGGEIVIVTEIGPAELLFEALKKGASGYLLKGKFSAFEIPDFIRQASRGLSAMTPSVASMIRDYIAATPDFESLTVREQEVIDLLVTGMTNKQIGEELFIASDTVKYHVKNILRRLHLSNRIEIVVEYTRRSFRNIGTFSLSLTTTKPSYRAGERIECFVSAENSGRSLLEAEILLIIPDRVAVEYASIQVGDFDPDGRLWTLRLEGPKNTARLDLSLRTDVVGSHTIRAVLTESKPAQAATCRIVNIEVV